MNTDWVLCLFLAIFGLWDLRTRKIPRFATLAALAAGLILRREGVLFGFLAGALFFPLFLLRMLGAADVKVIAVIAGFLGPARGTRAVAAGLVLGAVWSLFKLIRGGILLRRISYFTAYIRRMITMDIYEPYYRRERDGEELGIPLASCLAAGTALCLLLEAGGWF